MGILNIDLVKPEKGTTMETIGKHERQVAHPGGRACKEHPQPHPGDHGLRGGQGKAESDFFVVI